MSNKQAVIPLFGRDYTSKSPTVTAQLLTNMYREPQQDQDKSPVVLYQTPGLFFNINFNAVWSFQIAGDMPCRGAITINTMTWAVFGPWVVGFGNSAGPGGPVGISGLPLLTTSGRVGMSTSGSQLLVVDGVAGYVISLIPNDGGPAGGSFDIIKIVDVDFPNGASVTDFINGFFLVDNPLAVKPGQFNWSASYNANSWNALDFANAETDPDQIVQIKVKAGQIYLFGEDSYEVWAPSSDSAIFRRMGGTGAEWGCAARWTLADFGDNTLVMLAKNRLGQFMPVKVVGYNTEPIGGPDPEIVHDMNRTSAGQATAYTYSIDAHAFYQVNFGDRSYLYDSLSNAWSKITSAGGRHYGEIRVPSAPGFGSLPAKPFVFDYRNPNMYQQDDNTYVDYQDPIIRTLVSKHVFTDYERVSINELYLDVEVGTADVPSSGVPPRSPQIMLEWSKDGGRTYGNQIFQSMGQIGEYQTRVRWLNLGIARDWVFRFSFSENNKIVIVNAAVRVS